jgi:serine/threonine-protein kinase PpkA
MLPPVLPMLANLPAGRLASHGRRSLGGYRIASLLGRGRRSTVYLAHGRDGSAVALKVATQDQLRAFGGEADFAGEFARTSTLAHENVIHALGHGVDGQEAFLVLEHAGEGSLLPEPGVATHAEVHALATQAAGALAHVHAQGWVHRDVKPANLLRRADGSLALADFGCACVRGQGLDAPAGTLIGTPLYCAPEQAQGARAEPPADVYSLGVVLHELISGHPPFPGRTVLELLGQHLLAPVPALPAAWRAWQPLLEAMLAKDPQQRPADGGAVLLRLQRDASSLVLPGAPAASGDLS